MIKMKKVLNVDVILCLYEPLIYYCDCVYIHSNMGVTSNIYILTW